MDFFPRAGGTILAWYIVNRGTHPLLRYIAVGAAALAAAALSSPSEAAPINYGDFVGINVIYKAVTEDSGTDPTPLFGAPNLAGDTLDFNPPSFNSSSTGAGGVDITDGTLTFMIEAKPNQVIDELQFSEAGDFTLAGFGGTGTFASVTADLFIDIVEVDDISINAIQIITSMTFTPSDGDWDLLNDGPGPAVNGTWTGSVDVDLLQVLADEGIEFTDGVTKVNVTLDNTLVTVSENGTSSFIAKKDTKGFSVTAMPEPHAALLLGLAAALLGAGRRIRS
jgi:hypothetical protein